MPLIAWSGKLDELIGRGVAGLRSHDVGVTLAERYAYLGPWVDAYFARGGRAVLTKLFAPFMKVLTPVYAVPAPQSVSYVALMHTATDTACAVSSAVGGRLVDIMLHTIGIAMGKYITCTAHNTSAISMYIGESILSPSETGLGFTQWLSTTAPHVIPRLVPMLII